MSEKSIGVSENTESLANTVKQEYSESWDDVLRFYAHFRKAYPPTWDIFPEDMHESDLTDSDLQKAFGTDQYKLVKKDKNDD